MTFKEKIIQEYFKLTKWLDFFSPIAELAIRIVIARVFLESGLVRIDNMNSTIWLYANEYKVPFISPVIAAYLGTAIELTFPILLVLGLFGRLSALVLLGMNVVIVTCYAGIPVEAVENHILWALILLMFFLRGTGKLSIDYWIRKKVSNNA